jgi:hypothetical protein
LRPPFEDAQAGFGVVKLPEGDQRLDVVRETPNLTRLRDACGKQGRAHRPEDAMCFVEAAQRELERAERPDGGLAASGHRLLRA